MKGIIMSGKKNFSEKEIDVIKLIASNWVDLLKDIEPGDQGPIDEDVREGIHYTVWADEDKPDPFEVPGVQEAFGITPEELSERMYMTNRVKDDICTAIIIEIAKQTYK